MKLRCSSQNKWLPHISSDRTIETRRKQDDKLLSSLSVLFTLCSFPPKPFSYDHFPESDLPFLFLFTIHSKYPSARQQQTIFSYTLSKRTESVIITVSWRDSYGLLNILKYDGYCFAPRTKTTTSCKNVLNLCPTALPSNNFAANKQL